MKKYKFRIQQNTDSIDTREQCIGLDAWVLGDSVNMLNSNRGLHIQIKHNQDIDTFEASKKLSKLVAAAPKLLELLKLSSKHIGGIDDLYHEIKNLIKDIEQ